MLPSLDPETGELPPGEHEATWDETVGMFGWNTHRRRLLDGLAESLDLLRAAGCSKIWLDGSFVTSKEEPGDFDVSWDTSGVDFDILDPILSDDPAKQKLRFGGELYPEGIERSSGLLFSEFFQRTRPPDSRRRGIVVLRL